MGLFLSLLPEIRVAELGVLLPIFFVGGALLKNFFLFARFFYSDLLL